DPGGRVEGLQAGDLDGDGHADLALALLDSGQVGLYAGQSDGTFDDLQTFAAGDRPTHLALVDVNDDDHLDVVVVNASLDDDEGVSLLLNDGQGSLGAPVFTAMGADVEDMLLIDLKAN